MDKQAVREQVWDDLDESGVARFPYPPHGRIPNFEGADRAAERLAESAEWAAASMIKANPDAPQLPVRRRALHADKTVYMAVPRLREARCFIELDPTVLTDPDAAATVSGIGNYGKPVGPADVPSIDLVVVGSVAVSVDGGRLGKGEGYSDLEYAVLAAFDHVGAGTPVATTVHERQVVDDLLPPATHDVPLDLIATPERTVRTMTPYPRPAGLDWSRLAEERIAEIPVLEQLRQS